MPIQDFSKSAFIHSDVGKPPNSIMKPKTPTTSKDFLGHKELRNTEIYINIERTIFEATGDGFTVKILQDPEKIKRLLEVGFEYVCQKDNLIFLRKSK